MSGVKKVRELSRLVDEQKAEIERLQAEVLSLRVTLDHTHANEDAANEVMIEAVSHLRALVARYKLDGIPNDSQTYVDAAEQWLANHDHIGRNNENVGVPT